MAPRHDSKRHTVVIIGMASLILAFAASIQAQSLIEQVLSPQARAPQIEPSVWGGGTSARNGRNNGDRISDWRAGASTNIPLWMADKPGLEDARRRLRDPNITDEDRVKAFREATAPGFISANAFYEYRNVNDRLGTIPSRLVSTGLGIVGIHELEDHERPVRLGGLAEFAMRSDFEDTRLSNGQLTASAFLILPSGPHWTFVTGLAYASRVQDEDLEGIPLPFFAAAYVPSREFTLVLGLPFNMVMWRPYEWLELRGVAVGGLNGEVSVTEHITEDFSLRQFYGSTGEVYDLTRPGLPQDSRLIFTALRAGNEVNWNATSWLSLSLRYDFVFEGRVRTQDKQTTFTDRYYEPGHALRLSAQWRF